MNFVKIAKFFLYLVPLTVIIVTPSTLFPFIVGKYVFFRTTTSLALFFFLLGRLTQPQTFKLLNFEIFKLLFRQPLVASVIVFVIVFVLAGFLGVDPPWSFWSNFERGEGGLQMLYLGIFFLLLVIFFDENDWRIMLGMFVAAAVLMIFYGVGSVLKYVDAGTTTIEQNGVSMEVLSGNGGPFFKTFKGFIGASSANFTKDRFIGSIGNSSYAAVYLVFALFFAAYLLLDKYRHRLKSAGALSLMAAMALFLIFFFLAATRGAFIGLIGAGLASLIYLGVSVKKWRKRFALAGIAVLLAVGSLVYFRDSSFVKSLPGSRIFDISFQTENFQNRMEIWRMAFDGFKERPFLGWGPENFTYAFDRHYNIEHFHPKAEGFGAWYDRAHNVFLDYLVQAGLLGLLSFIGIFVVFYWQLIKSTHNKQQTTNNKNRPSVISHQLLVGNMLLFATPIAYLIQGMVLFDILPTYISLFLFLAFANYKFYKT